MKAVILMGAGIASSAALEVATILTAEGGERTLARIMERYQEATGYAPRLFQGSSMGALELGYDVARI